MKFGNLKIGQRLGAGFGLVIVLMLASSLLGLTRIRQVTASIDQMSQDFYPKTALANSVKDELSETARSMRNVLFASTAAEIERELNVIGKAGMSVSNSLMRFEKMNLSNEERPLLDNVKEARQKFTPALDQYVKLVREGQIEQARDLALPEIIPLQRQYFASLDRLIQHEGKLMERAGKDATELSADTGLLMISLAGIGTLLAMIVGALVTRSITRPLISAVEVARRVAGGDLTAAPEVRSHDETGQLLAALREMNRSLVATVGQVRNGTDTISVASREISFGNADLSSRTHTQAAALQQTASSMEELTTIVSQNAESAVEADRLSGTALERARKGGQVVGEVVATMGSIKESSRKIVDIISVIDSIAFQTNILALNAAVEAARAGDQGRGFAVVAAEVRGLAQRSAAAAREIKELITDSVENVESGNRLVSEAGKAMDEIVSSVQHVAGIMREISNASREQSSGIEEVNRAVAKMDQMTQQNAALVEQAASAAESLQAQAAQLSQAVSIFKLESDEPAPSPSPSHSAGTTMLEPFCAGRPGGRPVLLPAARTRRLDDS